MTIPRRSLFPSLFVFAASLTVLAAEQAAPTITSALKPFVEKQELAGAVVWAGTVEKGASLSTVGFADIEARVPMKDDTLFWIASMSKPMTGAAVMMLVDEGKIRLDDPVEKYLPEFKGQQLAILKDGKQTGTKAPARLITVRDVLSHTSGLPFKSPEEQPTLDGLPLEKAVKTYASHPLVFEPGKDFLYSNAGINTAARILEVVSGMAYEDFMAKRLFEPLGMADTTFWPNESQVARLAKSYKPGKDGKGLEPLLIGQLYYPLGDRSKRFPMPAGGLFSTAADVGVFGLMILNGGEWKGRRYLSQAAVEELTRRQTPPELSRAYGLGWAVDPDGAGHGGAFATNLSVDKKHGLVLVYMVQHSGFPGEGKKALGAFKAAAVQAFAKP
ncbi:MAG: serine hydrolase domain-containing protein [Verrucomicrobiota bacterium]